MPALRRGFCGILFIPEGPAKFLIINMSEPVLGPLIPLSQTGFDCEGMVGHNGGCEVNPACMLVLLPYLSMFVITQPVSVL